MEVFNIRGVMILTPSIKKLQIASQKANILLKQIINFFMIMQAGQG